MIKGAWQSVLGSRGCRILLLAFAGCASETQVPLPKTTQFDDNPKARAAFLVAYRAGYESGLTGESSVIDYFGRQGTIGTATEAGWMDGQSEGRHVAAELKLQERLQDIRAEEAAGTPAPKTFIPAIATIAGIKVGFSSMEELERRLGKGKVMTGGHPSGARLWRVDGTSWVIAADAFDYSERGAVLDFLSITVDPKRDQDVPYVRVTKSDLAWMGKISLGMSEDKLLESLRQSGCAATKVADGWQVTARGYSPLTSLPLEPLREWVVRLSLKEKSLVRIQFEARYGAKEKT